MSDLKKLKKIKGIGEATVEKLEQFGVSVINDLTNLDEEDLTEIGLTSTQAEKIIGYLQNSEVQSTIPADEMVNAEQNFNITRASQEHYDRYKKTQIRQVNKLPCPNCGNHMSFYGATFFGDLGSDDNYVCTKTHCNGEDHCLESRHVWKLVPLSQEEIDDLPFVPLVE